MIRLAPAMLLTLLGACGGDEARVGSSDPGEVIRDAPPVELELRSSDGAMVHVGDLRGKPVLLFLFATFDGVSQASLQPVSRFVRSHPDVYVLGIAVQPGAADLADAWAHALSPPFIVAYDPYERLGEGTTDLGTIDTVPTFIVLDADGRVRDRHVGFASQARLERLVFPPAP